MVSIEDHVHVPFETIVGIAYNNKYFPYTCTLTLTFWLNTVVTVLEGNNGPLICFLFTMHKFIDIRCLPTVKYSKNLVV